MCFFIVGVSGSYSSTLLSYLVGTNTSEWVGYNRGEIFAYLGVTPYSVPVCVGVCVFFLLCLCPYQIHTSTFTGSGQKRKTLTNGRIFTIGQFYPWCMHKDV